MDITIGNQSESTGRFNFVRAADGDVSFDDTETHAVVTSVVEHEAGYWADPRHGSQLHQLRSLTSRTPSQAEAIAREALSPMEGAREIVRVKVTATADRLRGRLRLDLNWSTPGGTQGSTTVDV